MPTHLTDRQIEEYHRRALLPMELLEVDDHLAVCPECRLRLAEGEPLSGALETWEGVAEADPGESRRWRPALWAAALLLLAGGGFLFRLVKPSETGEIGSGQSVLRGPVSAPKFTLQAPLSSVVPGGRPTFRWTPLAGAESYRVMVFDRNFNLMADSGPLSRTDWTPDQRLPGGAYTWQVKAWRAGEELTAPGPGLPQALFRVGATPSQSPSPIRTNPAQ